MSSALTGTMITVPANGTTAQAYLALPPGGHGPGVIVIQEWWGLVDHIKHVADRVAAAGYVALAPDLYKGEVATAPDQAQRLMMELDLPHAARALRGAAETLLAHDAVSPKKIGAVGFCMGGQLALYAATAHPDLISAVVDFYGVFNPSVPVALSALRAPVLAHFGEHDTNIPKDKTERLAADIAAAGGNCTMHYYDAGHAFFNDSRPTVYTPAAATLAWSRTMDFLGRTLR